MGIIHELSDSIKSKIAAGEVIERPAYIVKELVDNAIDAKAENIRVDLEKNGLGKIVVTDDGVGMDKEDLLLCFKRYTTSKIVSIDDLSTIHSMGFRGEALASISAIAKVTIKSRKSDQVSGHELILDNGKLQQIRAKGMPSGTQIKIEDIFVSVPVRQKFLKSAQTEYRHIIEMITRFIIAFPEIRFDVYHEGKKVFLFPKSSVEERVENTFSNNAFMYLLPFQSEKEYISLKGFISKPQLSYKSSRHSYIFINNRYVTDPTLISAIKEVYGTLLEPTSYPHVVLFLEIPPHFIDVNVHPRKESVHFVNNQMIIGHLQESIKEALSKANLRFYDKRWSGDSQDFDEWQIRDGGTNTYAAKKLKKNVLEKESLFSFSPNQSFFQIHNLYIAVSSKKGIIFFDQHAVHERILYEKLYKEFQKELKSNSFHTLKKPVAVSVTSEESILLEEHKELLSTLGLHFEIHENNIFFIKVPKILQDRNIVIMLREIIDELFQKVDRINFEYITSKMIAYLACRGAIKAGDKITQKQCKELIEELKKTENPYTCPHGRPTQVEIDLTYFHKLFKRQ